MNYCTHCAGLLTAKVPEDDNRLRLVCTKCGMPHYQNPKIVAGCLPVWEGRQVLLCKRAISPRFGFWTLPAGFMEQGETVAEAATREASEEARIQVILESLFTVFSVPYADQVHMMFRARLVDRDFSTSIETQAVALFNEDEMPWSHIAFPTIYHTLRAFFADRMKGKFTLHVADIMREGEGKHQLIPTFTET